MKTNEGVDLITPYQIEDGSPRQYNSWRKKEKHNNPKVWKKKKNKSHSQSPKKKSTKSIPWDYQITNFLEMKTTRDKISSYLVRPQFGRRARDQQEMIKCYLSSNGVELGGEKLGDAIEERRVNMRWEWKRRIMFCFLNAKILLTTMLKDLLCSGPSCFGNHVRDAFFITKSKVLYKIWT